MTSHWNVGLMSNENSLAYIFVWTLDKVDEIVEIIDN